MLNCSPKRGEIGNPAILRVWLASDTDRQFERMPMQTAIRVISIALVEMMGSIKAGGFSQKETSGHDMILWYAENFVGLQAQPPLRIGHAISDRCLGVLNLF